jgi:hypothetical protein
MPKPPDHFVADHQLVDDLGGDLLAAPKIGRPAQHLRPRHHNLKERVGLLGPSLTADAREAAVRCVVQSAELEKLWAARLDALAAGLPDTFEAVLPLGRAICLR